MPPLKRKRPVNKVDSTNEIVSTSPRRSSRKKSIVSYEQLETDEITTDGRKSSSPSTKSKKQKVTNNKLQGGHKAKRHQRVAQSPKHKQGKQVQSDDAIMSAPRVANALKLIGAHVSAAGGVDKAIENARWIGGNSFALFLKSQRKWASPPLSEETVRQFKLNCNTESYDPLRSILPHGSYLVNLATSDPDLQSKSYDCFIDDLHRCDRLGIKLYNFHPGATRSEITIEEGCRNIAKAVNRALEETRDVVVLLENMVGAIISSHIKANL